MADNGCVTTYSLAHIHAALTSRYDTVNAATSSAFADLGHVATVGDSLVEVALVG